jgi:hypothetical protein
MVPVTRSRCQLGVDHFVTVLCAKADDSPLAKSLAHCDYADMQDVALITEAEMKDLAYDDSGTLTPLSNSSASFVRIFKAYFEYRCESGDPIEEDFTSITRAEFNQFRVGPVYRDIRDNPRVKTQTNSSTTNTIDPMHEFRKGVKRDPSLFPILKDEKQWDEWQCSMIAHARAQDVVDVFNPNYVPVTPADRVLLEAKKTYVFAILQKVLQTDKGKACVRAHEITP